MKLLMKDFGLLARVCDRGVVLNCRDWAIGSGEGFFCDHVESLKAVISIWMSFWSLFT